MFYSLMSYMRSSDFHPGTVCSVAALQKLLK
jgi:hypothetical protein